MTRSSRALMFLYPSMRSCHGSSLVYTFGGKYLLITDGLRSTSCSLRERLSMSDSSSFSALLTTSMRLQNESPVDWVSSVASDRLSDPLSCSKAVDEALAVTWLTWEVHRSMLSRSSTIDDPSEGPRLLLPGGLYLWSSLRVAPKGGRHDDSPIGTDSARSAALCRPAASMAS